MDYVMMSTRLLRYNSSRLSKLQRQFTAILKAMSPLLEDKYGIDGAALFRQEVLADFRERVSPHIPYVGGKANPYTIYLEQSAMGLALYHVVMERGGSAEEAGQLIYNGMYMFVDKFPKTMFRMYGRWLHSRLQYPRMRKTAQDSHLRKYPEDWVYDFVEGERGAFNYGIDIYECGILKFLKKQNAMEIAPYLCAVDFITYHGMGVELQRTETLVTGCKCCKFRIIVPGKPLKPSLVSILPKQQNPDSSD
jgi:hypothetical protein